MLVPEEARAMDQGDELLSPTHVAKMFDLTPGSIRRWFWEGKLRGIKLGEHNGSVRIFKSSVDDLIKNGEQV